MTDPRIEEAVREYRSAYAQWRGAEIAVQELESQVESAHRTYAQLRGQMINARDALLDVAGNRLEITYGTDV